ncbi:MAG: GTPase HflX [Liquorilactobacillus nagelii]|jgi:GTP-binding protein HflX|uniref:GTPase HflX n=1 Tax=Liquorilactobacillus nagelii TaxID=82688 RepID=UPI0024300CEE|nr:GTPase HflX [Liquorilactobacillus nagelii]MCI1633547.1 GTPase HflX [Liquorilactobacillus nagelii]MCI1921519.1 GTPase HflX [Liquorilactobacillus nagelii]MCI1976689.1 GTPase HflX [Liquorilactobacillus nagelii]
MTEIIIAGLDQHSTDFDYSMAEFASLAEAAEMHVLTTLTQAADHPTSGTYFGRGKADELATAVTANQAEALLVNDQLSPTQLRNLEEIVKVPVIDRTELILEIFSRRARTKRAKLQVEIARLKYQLPRLRVSGFNKLDQQSSGGQGANRGAGETQHELTKRTLQQRINQLRHQLQEIAKENSTQSRARQRSGLPLVAFVGYTNAGKSTTFNGLLDLFGEKTANRNLVKDQLFATLDTSIRRLDFKDNKSFLISDTVGFINDLPADLLEAFKTTLETVNEADLLIQVVDLSHSEYKKMMAATEKTLQQIGAGNIPMLYAYNKADKLHLTYPLSEGGQLTYSAIDQNSLIKLVALIKNQLFGNYQQHDYLIPFQASRFLEEFNQQANILETSYTAAGTLLKAEVSPKLAQKFVQFQQ